MKANHFLHRSRALFYLVKICDMAIKNITVEWVDPETKTQYQVSATFQKRNRGNLIDIKQVKLNGQPQYQPFSDEQVDSMKTAISSAVK